MNQDKFSKFIKDIRVKNKLTQKEFADKFGVTYQAVSKWENGLNMPDLPTLKEICREYDMSVDEFLEGTKKKNKYIKYVILLIVILIISITLIIVKNKDNDFTFKTISSDCDSFTLTGSIAYNNDKTSIYISNISYCGTEFLGTYNYINASLYEKNNDNIILLDSKKYDLDGSTSITSFLDGLTFNIEGHSKTCKEYGDDNLYIEVYAIDMEGKTILHKIPLKIEENC